MDESGLSHLSDHSTNHPTLAQSRGESISAKCGFSTQSMNSADGEEMSSEHPDSASRVVRACAFLAMHGFQQ